MISWWFRKDEWLMALMVKGVKFKRILKRQWRVKGRIINIIIVLNIIWSMLKRWYHKYRFWLANIIILMPVIGSDLVIWDEMSSCVMLVYNDQNLRHVPSILKSKLTHHSCYFMIDCDVSNAKHHFPPIYRIQLYQSHAC